jgi:hypothetical protein
VYLTLGLNDDEPEDRKALLQILNGEHETVNALKNIGWRIDGIQQDDTFWTIDLSREHAHPEPVQELPRDTQVIPPASSKEHIYDSPSEHIYVPEQDQGVGTKESSVATPAEDRDEHGHSKNTSPQAVAVRRMKLRNIFTAITKSTTGSFDDVFAQYDSVYGENRFAVWLWIFESKGWVFFDTRWKIAREPTDVELDEVTKSYLQKHGNYDMPDATCRNDLLKRERSHSRRDAVVVPKLPSERSAQREQTEMSWPEMKKAYAAKRDAEKHEEQEKPRAPAPKNRRFDWEKVLAGVRDILFDATDPLSATEIKRRLGENAPDLSNIIYYMERDGRFARGEKKLWRLATEEEAEPEEEDEAHTEAAADEKPESDRKPGPRTMLDPDLDEQRMARWRRELGPDRKPYDDED